MADTMNAPEGPRDARDLGPAEAVMNNVRYVREETLFAAMREADRLRAALVAARAVIDEDTHPKTAEMIAEALR